MKAAVLYGNRDIRYEDYNEPPVLANDVKIEIHVSGICGSDIPRVFDNGAHFYPIVACPPILEPVPKLVE